MGVKGLLPCLQSITRSVPLERYRGLTVAVDAMSWLHKGVFACDVKALAHSQRNEVSERPVSSELKCIQYTTNKVDILRVKFGINVILVIDGDALPSKREENEHRREEREKAFHKAISAEQAHDSRAARRYYAQSCSVTYKIRYELIKRCKESGIPFLVAPYEADAQMARLAHTGIVDLVITEDSDILVYGCPRALFKVDFDTLQGQEIQLMRDLGENTTLSFQNWTHDMFVFMCIISGCDYCKGLPGIGIKLAHKLVRVHRTPSKIFSALNSAGRMPPGFEETFWIAFRTFRHQRVFCTSKQLIEPLWPIDGSNHENVPKKVWPFLGEYIEPHIANKIVDGNLHPSMKIAWEEALKIHRNPVPNESRMTSTDSNTRNQIDANSKATNVWYSLVYGSNNVDRHSNIDGRETQQDTQRNIPNRSMFSFFPQKKDQRNDVTAKAPIITELPNTIRPPLREIYVGTENNAPHHTASQPTSEPHQRDIPIHFHDYVSKLVGRAFEPISRKRKKMESDGTKSSQYVKKIWEKRSHVHPTDPITASESMKVNDSDAEGVGRFMNNPTRMDVDYANRIGECHNLNQPYEMFDGMPPFELPSPTNNDFSSAIDCHRPMNHSVYDDYVCTDANSVKDHGYHYRHDALPQSQLDSSDIHNNIMAFTSGTDPFQRDNFQQSIINQYYGGSNPFQQLETAMKRKRNNTYFTDDTDLVADRCFDSTYSHDGVDKGYIMSEPAPVPVEFQQLHTIRKSTRRGNGSGVTSVDHCRDVDIYRGADSYDNMTCARDMVRLGYC